MKSVLMVFVLAIGICSFLPSCGKDANEKGVGKQCTTTSDCGDAALTCLTSFKGGYCGKSPCTASSECPSGSRCIIYSGTSYCFLTCTVKDDCNKNRDTLNESNCSSNYDDTEGSKPKACIPPNA
jgi:hypothetical protein